MENISAATQALHKHACVQKAKILRSFFKTGKGQYSEGDIFIGVTVPQIRTVAKEFSDLETNNILQLLHSYIHEERMLALFIWVIQYERGDNATKRQITEQYLKNTRWINNWDLVDLSAYKIIGDFLLDKKRDILYDLAKSKLLWERRIAVVSALAFIRKNQFDDILRLVEALLKDTENLIHKACGWMLREVGKRDETILVNFLDKQSGAMPRVMLRYAIERFGVHRRHKYLNK
jgi:3-methyladenine DNA glycosylase AlkD